MTGIREIKKAKEVVIRENRKQVARGLKESILTF
jgi:hypothetical protein